MNVRQTHIEVDLKARTPADWSAQFEGSLRTHNDMDTSTLCNGE